MGTRPDPGLESQGVCAARWTRTYGRGAGLSPDVLRGLRRTAVGRISGTRAAPGDPHLEVEDHRAGVPGASVGMPGQRPRHCGRVAGRTAGELPRCWAARAGGDPGGAVPPEQTAATVKAETRACAARPTGAPGPRVSRASTGRLPPRSTRRPLSHVMTEAGLVHNMGHAPAEASSR
jgi:hypothetical protein